MSRFACPLALSSIQTLPPLQATRAARSGPPASVVDWDVIDRTTLVVSDNCFGVPAIWYWLCGRRITPTLQDSRLPAEFDATSAVLPGRNTLAVQVMQFCDGSYLEDQDHWWLAGVHRDVALLYKPPSRLTDFAVTAQPSLPAASSSISHHHQRGHSLPSAWVEVRATLEHASQGRALEGSLEVRLSLNRMTC